MKTITKKGLSILSVLLCANLTLSSAGLFNNNSSFSAEIASYVPTISALPYSGEEVNLLDGDILEFASDYELGKATNYLPKGFGPGNDYREDDFAPVGIQLSWKSAEDVQYYTVKVSTTPDLSDFVGYITLDTTLELTDLFAGTDYYYQIIAQYADRTVKSQIFTFHTANLIRTIELEGVSNTRDIGGYYTIDGKKRIRQGMVYRGARLEAITAAGIEKALNVYGIKTDLDLRGEASSSPLGTSVNFINVSGPYYTNGTNSGTAGIDCLEDSSKGPWQGTYRDALIKEIQTFANPDNYPIYVHCSVGRDRTGTIVGLINALCGVGELDLCMDYEASYFSERGCTTGLLPVERLRMFNTIFSYVEKYEKATLAENVEAFMLDIGITAEEIASIRSILLEEVV
ncbi:MAG: tyrosine-protein phosphatase [Clostridia bacterium]|nr:tyrosine-protein phosphatase [Clostridia bacterium]